MEGKEKEIKSPVMYTVKEYAELFKVDIDTVYRWIRKKEVETIRHGRTIRILKRDN